MMMAELVELAELQDYVVGAVVDAIVEHIAEWLWNNVQHDIEDTFTKNAQVQIWQHLADRLIEIADNLRAHSQYIARQ